MVKNPTKDPAQQRKWGKGNSQTWFQPLKINP